MAITDYVYTDLTSGLDITPLGEFKVIHDEDVLEQSIRRILSTISGERIRTLSGSSLSRFLFEKMTDDTIQDLHDTIVSDLRSQEPRLNLNDVLIKPDYDNNTLLIEIRYS